MSLTSSLYDEGIIAGILALCLWGFRKPLLLRGPVQISSKIKIIPRLVTSTFQVCTSDYVERMMWQH